MVEDKILKIFNMAEYYQAQVDLIQILATEKYRGNARKAGEDWVTNYAKTFHDEWEELSKQLAEDPVELFREKYFKKNG